MSSIPAANHQQQQQQQQQLAWLWAEYQTQTTSHGLDRLLALSNALAHAERLSLFCSSSFSSSASSCSTSTCAVPNQVLNHAKLLAWKKVEAERLAVEEFVVDVLGGIVSKMKQIDFGDIDNDFSRTAQHANLTQQQVDAQPNITMPAPITTTTIGGLTQQQQQHLDDLANRLPPPIVTTTATIHATEHNLEVRYDQESGADLVAMFESDLCLKFSIVGDLVCAGGVRGQDQIRLWMAQWALMPMINTKRLEHIQRAQSRSTTAQ